MNEEFQEIRITPELYWTEESSNPHEIWKYKHNGELRKTLIRKKYSFTVIKEDPRTWPTGPEPLPEPITIKITEPGPLGPNQTDPFPDVLEIEEKINLHSKWVPSEKIERYVGRTGHVSVDYHEVVADISESWIKPAKHQIKL